MSVKLIGGPCDGWEVDWLDSGHVAHFMAPGEPHPHAYYLAKDGRTAVWQVDALRSHLSAEMRTEGAR